MSAIADQQFASFFDIVESSRQHLSTIKPSDWAEANRIMTSSASSFQGPYRYSKTPYWREVIDCLSPNHPAQWIAVMKGTQIGYTAGVIENGIGWIIDQNPGNILFANGKSGLAEEILTTRIDPMIDVTGLRPMIRPNALRKKNARTGNTNKMKDPPGGFLIANDLDNHVEHRARSMRYGFFDDVDAARKESKDSGDTFSVVEQRFSSYFHNMKIFWGGSPELEDSSNVLAQYLKGDQRRWVCPCPKCGAYIPWDWSVDLKGTEGKEKAGIIYKLDHRDRLIVKSVGYICQECGGYFDERKKLKLLNEGYWHATTDAYMVGFYSFHISSLYAPPGMFDWPHYVAKYLEANPPGKEREEAKHQTFVNTVLAQAYKPEGKSPKANDLQKNCRDYPVGVIPERLSVVDGNGKIVLVTAAFDLNGKEDDARVDYEILAWSEAGANYSVKHGSIGTFIPNESGSKVKEDRVHWTYHHNRDYSVWDEVEKVLEDSYQTDTDKRMKITIAGIDCGHYSTLTGGTAPGAYAFIDKLNNALRVGLKGRDESKFIRIDADIPPIRTAKERPNLYLVEVNHLKDDLAKSMRLIWDTRNDAQQPPDFMNYPMPSAGLYTFNSYFSHYEAEQKIPEKKDNGAPAFLWKKKNSAVQNHFWDVRVYNMGLRHIMVQQVGKAMKLPKPTWGDYCDVVLDRFGK